MYDDLARNEPQFPKQLDLSEDSISVWILFSISRIQVALRSVVNPQFASNEMNEEEECKHSTRRGTSIINQATPITSTQLVDFASIEVDIELLRQILRDCE